MTHDVNYDSDTVDADLEADLYASVYFDNEEDSKHFCNESFSQNDKHLIPNKSPSPPVQPIQKPQAFMEISEITLPPASSSPDQFFTPQTTTSFEWKLPSDLEKSVTSLSSVADAIYLTLTGEMPPSIRQSSEMKRRSETVFVDTSKVNRFSISDDSVSAQTPNKISKGDISNVTFTLSDQDDDAEDDSSGSSNNTAISISEESDSESERAMSDFDASDIILGVSSAAKNSFAGHQGDDAIMIANMLCQSSSEPACWRIDAVDKMPHLASRYYQPSQNTICSICSKKGHDAKECLRSGPVCILCGKEGHFSSRCQARYCSACLSSGHTYSDCHQRFRLRDETCPRCKQVGHSKNTCTAIWRQYRDTTKEGKPIPIVDFKAPKSCCNCGRHGHTVDDCRARPFRHSQLVRRRILVYDKRNIYERRLAKTVRISKEHIRRAGGGPKTIKPKTTRFGDATRQAKGRRQQGQDLLEFPFTNRQQANLKQAAEEASRHFRQDQIAEGVGRKEAIRRQKEARRMQKIESRMERKLFRQVLNQQMYPKMNAPGSSGTSSSQTLTTSPRYLKAKEEEAAALAFERSKTRNSRNEEPEYLGFNNSTSRPPPLFTPHCRDRPREGFLNGGKRPRGYDAHEERHSHRNSAYKTPSRNRRTVKAARLTPNSNNSSNAAYSSRLSIESPFNPEWSFDGYKTSQPFASRRHSSASDALGEHLQIKQKAVEDEDWYKRTIRQPRINSWETLPSTGTLSRPRRGGRRKSDFLP